jgi:hypothetical protein
LHFSNPVNAERGAEAGESAGGIRSGEFIDFQNTQGIIFVVGSNDRERVSEAPEKSMHMGKDEVRDNLLLAFANE